MPTDDTRPARRLLPRMGPGVRPEACPDCGWEYSGLPDAPCVHGQQRLLLAMQGQALQALDAPPPWWRERKRKA